MAVAVHVKTESSDDYLFVFDGWPSRKEVKEKVKQEMGEDFDYVSEYNEERTKAPKK